MWSVYNIINTFGSLHSVCTWWWITNNIIIVYTDQYINSNTVPTNITNIKSHKNIISKIIIKINVGQDIKGTLPHNIRSMKFLFEFRLTQHALYNIITSICITLYVSYLISKYLNILCHFIYESYTSSFKILYLWFITYVRMFIIIYGQFSENNGLQWTHE